MGKLWLWSGARNTFALVLGLIVLGLGLPAPPVRADALLVVPPIRQTFWPPEFTGQTYDRGVFDCVPASVAMDLQALQREGLLAASLPSDYPTVRRAFRARSPNARVGILPTLVPSIVAALSDGTVDARVVRTSAGSWPVFLDDELGQQRPVIAIIGDWSRLAGRWSPPGLVHAIVVTGHRDGDVFYDDPWDGKSYWMSDAAFGAAWGATPNAWLAISIK